MVRVLQRVHYNPDTPFLNGNYTPVKDEVHVNGLRVIGTLPTELDGVYLRTGPNPQHEPIGGYTMCAATPLLCSVWTDFVHCGMHASLAARAAQ